MKTLISILVFVLICTTILQAQIITGYGIKTGATIANQNFDYQQTSNVSMKNRAGIRLGGFVQWLNYSNFTILTELHYVQRGMIYEQKMTSNSPNPVATMRFDNNVNYLSIPVLMKILFSKEAFSPYLAVGPRFDILMNYNSDFFSVIYKKFNNFDIGGDIGIGLENGILFLELRYNHSFSNSYQTQYLTFKNKAISVLTGIKL